MTNTDLVDCCLFETADADSALRERLERTRREEEYSKKKLQQQHEEAMEEQETAKKLLERKVSFILVQGFLISDARTEKRHARCGGSVA